MDVRPARQQSGGPPLSTQRGNSRTLENFGWSESARLMQRLEERLAAARDTPAGRMRDRRAGAPFEDVVGWFADLVQRVAGEAARPQ